MLADMHEYDGVRHTTYGDAVVNILGALGCCCCADALLMMR